MALRFYKIAIIYLIGGMAMGIYMGISHDFSWAPVHAHGNLLGWVSLALVGLAYQLFPAMAYSSLAAMHFWLHNIGLPLMLTGLTFILQGNQAIGMPITALGSLLAFTGILCLAANLWRNAHRDLAQGDF
jgi:cbb3-type cytochrome oxidase subunit 1